MRTSLDRSRRRLLSPVYNALPRNLRLHCGVSVFHGVAVCGRVFFGEICCLVVSERCVSDFLDSVFHLFKYFTLFLIKHLECLKHFDII